MTSSPLPLVIAGPVLRHTQQAGFTLWLVTSEPADIDVSLHQAQQAQNSNTTDRVIQVGEKAFIHVLTCSPQSPLAANTLYHYQLNFNHTEQQQRWQSELPSLCYPGQNDLHFRVPAALSNVLHGSCRKPHHPSEDSLVRVDELIHQECEGGAQRPDLLLMTGDQIYADDVAANGYPGDDGRPSARES